MKASAFLNTYYPTEGRKRQTSRYSVRSKEEWIADFVAQYSSIRPSSAKEYNVKREKDSPTWLTIARYLGAATWKELIELVGVEKPHGGNELHYSVVHTSPAYEKISLFLDNRDKKLTKSDKL